MAGITPITATATATWLRRQAIITGSPYWWERYQACLYY